MFSFGAVVEEMDETLEALGGGKIVNTETPLGGIQAFSTERVREVVRTHTLHTLKQTKIA